MSSKSEVGVKKLVSVLAIFTLMTGTREKAVETTKAVKTTEVSKDGEESKGEYPNLIQVLCIRYPIIFRKKSMSAFLDSGSKVNIIYLTFAQELRLSIRPTDVGAEKADGTMLDTYGIVVTVFSMMNKANQVRFFEKSFLVANISPKIVFGILFFTLSSGDVDFLGWKLRWKTYTTEEALPTTRHVKLVSKKEFTAAALDSEYETYVVHIGSVSSNVLPSSSLLKLNVHLSCRPQVSSLIAEEALTKIPAEYSDFVKIFSPDLISELLKHNGINNHAIKLVKDCQQPPYESISSLRLMELETLKAYIKTHLANGFIKPSKSPANAPILFDQKSNGSLQLYIDY